MKKLRVLSLVAAIFLTIVVLFLVFLAIFDSNAWCIAWRSVVAQFQTFLGGVSVLAASLFAYHANTAMAQEANRKNHADEEKLKSSNLAKATLTIEMIRQQSHARLIELQRYSNDFTSAEIPILQFEKLTITMPRQWLELWDHLDLFSNDSYYDIAKITNLIQIYISEQTQQISEYNKIVELLKEMQNRLNEITSNFELMNSAQTSSLTEITTKINALYAETHQFSWKRAGNLLEEINRSSLNVMQSLPLAEDWHPEVAPYPSKQFA